MILYTGLQSDWPKTTLMTAGDLTRVSAAVMREPA